PSSSDSGPRSSSRSPGSPPFPPTSTALNEDSAMMFHATIQLAGKTATGIEIPADLVTALASGKCPPVRVTINGYTYRSTIAVRAGRYLVGISSEVRAAAGVAAGDTVEVGLELDTSPREIDIP